MKYTYEMHFFPCLNWCAENKQSGSQIAIRKLSTVAKLLLAKADDQIKFLLYK
jgi:hypothetical protein